MVQRPGESRGKPLDEGSTGPHTRENFPGDQYPAVHVLMMTDDEDDVQVVQVIN